MIQYITPQAGGLHCTGKGTIESIEESIQEYTEEGRGQQPTVERHACCNCSEKREGRRRPWRLSMSAIFSRALPTSPPLMMDCASKPR